MSISGAIDDFVKGVTKGAGKNRMAKDIGKIKKVKSNGAHANVDFNRFTRGIEHAAGEIGSDGYKGFNTRMPVKSSKEMFDKVDDAIKTEFAGQMKNGRLGDSFEIGDKTKEIMKTQEGRRAMAERIGISAADDADIIFSGAQKNENGFARKAGNFFGNPTYNAYQAHKSGKSLGESFDAGFRNAEGNVDVGKVAGTLSAGGVALGAARGVTTNANGERDIAGIPGI